MTFAQLLVTLIAVASLFGLVLWYLQRTLRDAARQFTLALTSASDSHAKLFKSISGEEAIAVRLDHFYARMEQQAATIAEVRRDLDGTNDRLTSHLQRYYRLQREETTENPPEQPSPQAELAAMLNQQTPDTQPLIRAPRRW